MLHILPLTCSVHGRIKKVLPVHVWLRVWPKSEYRPTTGMQRTEMLLASVQEQDVAAPSVAAPPRSCQPHGALLMGFTCAPWKAAKPPSWVRIWGLLEGREADGSSSISNVLWRVLLFLPAGVEGPMEGPFSLLRNAHISQQVLGWTGLWSYSSLAL